MPNTNMLGHDEDRYRKYRAQLAPGSALRDGLERIKLGHTGALVTLGINPVVESLASGGFNVTTDFTPTALRELAKMDGGIILSNSLDQILWAGVHFTPSAELPTVETGTRHRTADRLALQSNVPVVTVSASMGTIALFMSGLRYPIEGSDDILRRAEQALSALARYRTRLDEQTTRLSLRELSSHVTVGDVVSVLQPLTLVLKLAEEVEAAIAALGVDGRFLQLQHFELTNGVDRVRTLIRADYGHLASSETAFAGLRYLSVGDLLDSTTVASHLGVGTDLHRRIEAGGNRVVAQAGNLSTGDTAKLIETFGSLAGVIDASIDDLTTCGGLEHTRAQSLHEELTRMRALARLGDRPAS